MRTRVVVCLFASFILVTSCLAQTAPSPSTSAPAAKAPDYSQEAAVIDRYVTRIAFQADGSSERDISTAIRVQAEAGVRQLAVLAFSYTSASETVDVDYVRVRKPDGSVVVTPAYNILDMPADVTRQAPMYSDIHEKHITVKSLGVGDTLEYSVRFRTLKAEVPGQFWYDQNFINDTICKQEILEVSFPKDKYVNVSSRDVKPQIREENGRKIYTWTTSNLARVEPNKKELPKREQPQPSVELTTFHNWEEVGAWYAQLQKDRLTVTPEIQKKADEITKGITSDDEKIRAIYDFVSSRFHYISLSFGIGRYQPHAADDVLSNEYGDCKDKHTLFATMLKAVGIDAWPVLINSSRKIDQDLPSPSSFDHVITVVPRGSQMIWLDTTPEVSPFGFILAGLRGKQALVVPTGKPASLMKTPESTPFPSLEIFEAEGKLGADGVFTGHMERKSRGDIEVILRSVYRNVPQAQWKDLTQRLSYAWGFGGDVSDVKATSPEDTSKAFDISYDYTRKNYADWDNHRITPPMPPLGIEVPDTEDRKPVEPFLLGSVGEIDYHAKLELPSFSRAVAPSDLDLSEDFAEYHSHYSIKDGVLVADRKLVIKKSEVPVAEWDKYTKFRKAVADDEDHWIDLDGQPAAAKTFGPKFDDTEAGHKFQEAVQAVQNRDIIKATDLMHEVLRLNPRYEGANATLGWIDFMQNRRDEGLAEVHKEEELHPDYVISYNVAAWMYGVLRRPNDAANEWRKLLKVNPDNRDAMLKLSRLLIDEKKYADTVALLEPALKTAPDSSELKTTLAIAYLRSGEKQKGLAVIQKNFADSSDPVILNDLAYELAEADTGLDLARKLSEQSVKLLDAGTLDKKHTITDIAAPTLTFSLTSFWDTLGWIYFR